MKNTAIDMLKQNQNTSEWWAFLTGISINIAEQGKKEGDIDQAMWGALCAERSRAMLVYKPHLE